MFVFDLTKKHFNLAIRAKLQIEIIIKYKKCSLNLISGVKDVGG
jgi:hypothetical protein